MQRLILFVLAAVVLSACDSYIEEARVQDDGSIEFGALATVVCNDELQLAIWGEDPCPQIDTAVRTGDFGVLPLDVDLDPNRVSIVGDGEQDRRELQARWSGQPEELETLLVHGGQVRVLDEQRTEVVFSTANTAYSRLVAAANPQVQDTLGRSRWDPAQFRIRVPDLVEEHNADRIQGRILVWNFDDEVPDELRVVFTTEGPARHLWWLIVGLVALLVIIAMIVMLERPSKRGGNPTPPENVADSVPEDVAEPEVS